MLAAGWLLHLGWDTGLHLAIEQPVVGRWLPLLCIPIDLMVAVYLALAALAQPGPAEPAAARENP